MTDRLAEIRTTLANKRTQLAYFRTALALCAFGMACLKIYSHPLLVAFGLALIGAGLWTVVESIVIWRRFNRKISSDS